MELVKANRLKIILIYTLMLTLPQIVFADYSGPEICLSEKWGHGDNEIGIRHQDTADTFAKTVKVNILGNIAIMDLENNRVKIYSENGYLLSIIKPKNIKVKYTWPSFIGFDNENNLYTSNWDNKLQKYDKNGNLIWTNAVLGTMDIWLEDDGSLVLRNYKTEVYYKYSPTGQLLETYKERPLELGNIKTKSIGYRKYKTTIVYPDITYILNHFPCKKYVRGCDNTLYGYRTTSVEKYNESGELIYIFTPPKGQFKVIPAIKGVEDEKKEVVVEFGSAVVAPNGDVYTWKRTPDTYSILKWIWIESRDAPVNLKASTSDNKISLSWETPKQDTNSVKAYEIYRSSNVCGPFNKIDKVKKGVLQYTDKKVNKGEAYYYQVCAKRGSGYSGYSNKAAGKIDVSQTTSPEVPGDTYSKVEKDILAGKTINMAKLHSFNKNELKLLRNTIFAKYGRSFKSDMLKIWFAKKGWYNVDPNYSDSVLTDTDKKNITIFLNLEKKK